MTKDITVALDISDKSLAAQFKQKLAALGAIQVFESFNHSPAAKGGRPDIVITFSSGGAGVIAGRISAFRQQCPEASVFVVAADPQPEHIIEIMKSGAAELFLQPVDWEKFKEAIEKIRSQLDQAPSRSKGQVFSFISSKGGLGATVLATNTAAALAMRGSGTVALIDLSLQSGDSSVLLDIMPKTTIVDIYRNFSRLDLALFKGTMHRHLTGLDFLAAPVNPEESVHISGEHVGRILALSKSAYDTTIVDCSSMLVNDCAIEAFKASDKVFIVTDLSVPAIRNASRLVKLMPKIGINSRQVEIVINRFIKDKVSIHDVEKNLNKSVYWLFPNDYDFTVSSINQGIPLVKNNPSTGLAKNVADFAKKLLNPADFENYRGAKNLFGKAL